MNVRREICMRWVKMALPVAFFLLIGGLLPPYSAPLSNMAQAQDDAAGVEAAAEEFYFQPYGREQVQRQFETAVSAIQEGAGVEAATQLAALLNDGVDDLLATGDGRYIPLWLAVAEQSSGWPAEKVAALGEMLQGEALARQDELRRGGASLVELESAAQRYFVSSAGGELMMALGDRLRERGWSRLALYYYRLIERHHPDRQQLGSALAVRLDLVERMAGLESDGGGLLSGDSSSGYCRGNWASGAAVPVRPVLHWHMAYARRAEQWPGQLYARSPAVYPLLEAGRAYVNAWKNPLAAEVESGQSPWPVEPRPDYTRSINATGMQATVFGGLVLTPAYHERQGLLSVGHLQRMLPLSTSHIVLQAHEASDGKKLWSWDPRAESAIGERELSVEGRPLAAGGMIIVSLGTGGSFLGEYLTAAIDPQTRELLWHWPIASFGNDLIVRPRGGQVGQPVASFITGSLAWRGGLVISSQSGLSSVQSAASGRVLWLNCLREISPRSIQPPTDSRKFGTVRDGMVATMPRVLVDGERVICGSMFTSHVEAYDLTTGRRLWSRQIDDASQPFAVGNGMVYLWGRSLAALSLEDGAPRWRASLDKQLPLGEPCLSDDLIAATVDGQLWTVSASDGRTINLTALPQDVESGNVALSSEGLLIAGSNGLWCLKDWPKVEREMNIAARRDAKSTEPFLRLAEMAFSVDDTENVLKYLRAALERQNKGVVAGRIYRLAEALYLKHRKAADESLPRSILAVMSSSADGAENQTRQMLLEGEFHAGRGDNPTVALGFFQRVLSRAEFREVEHRNWVMKGLSAQLAEQRINQLIVDRGVQIYAPLEQQARKLLNAAAGEPAGPDGAIRAANAAAMLEVSQKYPNSRAALEAVEQAALLYYRAGKLAEAYNLLLVRINLAKSDEAAFGRLNAIAAHVALKRKRVEQAAYHAAAARKVAGDRAEISLPDGSMMTVGDIAAAIDAQQAKNRAVDAAAASPARVVFKQRRLVELPAIAVVDSRIHIRDLRNSDAAHDAAVIVPLQSSLAALDARNGNVLWQVELQRVHASRVLVTDELLFVGNGPGLRAIDMRDGKLRWQMQLADVPREAALGLTAVMEFGDVTLYPGQSEKELPRENVVFDLEMMHGFLAVTTDSSIRLVNPESGYSAVRIGDLMDNRRNTITFHVVGDGVVGLFGPPPIVNEYRIFDLHTRRKLNAGKFDHPMRAAIATTDPLLILPAGQNQPGVALDVAKGKADKVEAKVNGADAIATDARSLYVAGYRGELVCIDIASGKMRWRQTAKNDQQSRLNVLQLLPNERLLHANTRMLRVVDCRSGKLLWKERLPGTSQHQLVTADDHRAVVLNNGELQLWDLATGKLSGQIDTAGRRVTQALALNNGRRLILYHGNRSVTLLDAVAAEDE